MRHFVSLSVFLIFTAAGAIQELPAPLLMPRGKDAGKTSKSQQSSTRRPPLPTPPNRQVNAQTEPVRNNRPPVSPISDVDLNSGRNLKSRRKPQPKIQETSRKKSPSTDTDQRAASSEEYKPLTRIQAKGQLAASTRKHIPLTRLQAKRQKSVEVQKIDRVSVDRLSSQHGQMESGRRSRDSSPLRQSPFRAPFLPQYDALPGPELRSTSPPLEQSNNGNLPSLFHPNDKPGPAVRTTMGPPRSPFPPPEALRTGRRTVLQPQQAIRAKSPSREIMRMIPMHTISPIDPPAPFTLPRQSSTNLGRGTGLMSSQSGIIGSGSGRYLPGTGGREPQTNKSEQRDNSKPSPWSWVR